ncbi:MAG: tRNA uracil 4-sulfurtransferase ThiI, partial [Planctomycetota bacterium]
MVSTVVLVHYAEVGLKRGNRRWFEERLRENLVAALQDTVAGSIRLRRPRIVVETADQAGDAAIEEVVERVSRIPGVSWTATARVVESDLDRIRQEAIALARTGEGTFKVETRRVDKEFPLKSPEVSRDVGGAINDATGRKAKMKQPDDLYAIVIDRDHSFVVGSRTRGPGGLPVGTAGRVVALLSGGLDSPVAAWRMMRRGCTVLGVHFWNNAVGGEGVLEKLDLLSVALARVQGSFTLRIVPFEDLQRAIVASVPADYRMVIYRRTRLRIAERIRRDLDARALITGDAVGQVASQTLENLAAVYSAVNSLLLTPLAGNDKVEIVSEARSIGTYEASILPHDDCCSFLIAPHPVTRARISDVEKMEKRVAWGTLLDEAVEAIETRRYGGRQEGSGADAATTGSQP